MNNTWNFLNKYCIGLELKANDTFAYGAADSVHVDMMDAPKLVEMEERYGYDGVLAFMAKIEKCEPLKPLNNKIYKQAKKELKSYILFEDLDVNDKKAWNKWFYEYKALTGEDIEGELQ